MKFKIKPKPKINNKRLIQDKELEIESLETKFEVKKELEDDVTFKAEATIDLNPQVNMGLKDRTQKASFSFTKKF